MPNMIVNSGLHGRDEKINEKVKEQKYHNATSLFQSLLSHF